MKKTANREFEKLKLHKLHALLYDELTRQVDDAYTNLTLLYAKRVSSEEEIKSELTAILYQAYVYGKEYGWSLDQDLNESV